MTISSDLRKGVLTQKEAEVRARQVRDVEYQLFFRLGEDPLYHGKVEAHFEVTSDAARLSDQIFVDYCGEQGMGGHKGELQFVLLNGKPIRYEYDGAKISLPTQEFTVGKNILSIEFTNAYGHSGIGFHRTQDSADGEYYMYSDFEPYNANKAFPAFDQPDLKATYTLKVEAPSKWEIIANTLEKSKEAVSEGYTRWTFPTTVQFSTYLFALMAGPFQKWESSTKSGVPMRLFARKSLAQYVARDAEHWFQVTDHGFQFFEKAFGYPYPFGKYDQILTPDYNHGAMENVGAVTFTESYAFRTEVTPIQIVRRAETIIHELAHMWFGNLVTMKWWDDLWLNESFATYVSNLAMSKFPEYIDDQVDAVDIWKQFYDRNKEWAYREDDYITTHPIVGTAADTVEALANFDGITYGKGASVLKQLVHYLGEEDFLKGLKGYFKDFAFKNATRTDFLQALSRASGKDLMAWEEEWFKSSGTNSVQVEIHPEAGPRSGPSDVKIKQLVLRQFPDEADGRLRTHRSELGLYDLDARGEISLREILSVTYAEKETRIAEATGKAMPQFVFPNVGDHDFVHVILDEQSLTGLETSLWKISDPLLRQILWSTLWNMVRHAKLPAHRFAKIAMKNLEEEKDLAVLQKGLECLSVFLYFSPDNKIQYQKEVENFVSQLFKSAEPGAMQIMLFGRYVAVARSAQASAMLRDWLNVEEVTPGFKMDQERRWAVISQLSKNGVMEAWELIQKEREKDRNDKGVIAAMTAEAAFPEKSNKERWWKRLLGEDSNFEKLSIERARSVMRVFHDDDHETVTAFVNDAFFEVVPSLSGKFPDEFNSSFAALMYPCAFSDEVEARGEEFVKAHRTQPGSLPVGIMRELLKNWQLHQRVRVARKLSRTA